MAPTLTRFACFLLAVCALAGRVVAADDVVARWLHQQTNVTTWTADFVQTRRIPALARPLTSPGRVWFAAPDRFRWELGNPVQSVAVRNGGTLLVLSPRLKRAETLDLGAAARGPMRDALALLDTGFPRDAAEFGKRFEVGTVREEGGIVTMELKPREGGARRLVSGLGVTLTSGDLALAATELRFVDGTVMRNEFTNATANPKLAETLFDTAIPAGYTNTASLKR